MAKRQGDGQRSGEYEPPPERRGADSLGLATLAGVVAVLVISFAMLLVVNALSRRSGRRLGVIG